MRKHDLQEQQGDTRQHVSHRPKGTIAKNIDTVFAFCTDTEETRSVQVSPMMDKIWSEILLTPIRTIRTIDTPNWHTICSILFHFVSLDICAKSAALFLSSEYWWCQGGCTGRTTAPGSRSLGERRSIYEGKKDHQIKMWSEDYLATLDGGCRRTIGCLRILRSYLSDNQSRIKELTT